MVQVPIWLPFLAHKISKTIVFPNPYAKSVKKTSKDADVIFARNTFWECRFDFEDYVHGVDTGESRFNFFK